MGELMWSHELRINYLVHYAVALTSKDQPQIVSYLAGLCKEEVISVGVKLGLDYTSAVDSSNFRNDIVTRWLRKDYHVQSIGEPCWAILSLALESCGHDGIASTIRKGELILNSSTLLLYLFFGLKSMQNIRTFDSLTVPDNSHMAFDYWSILYTSPSLFCLLLPLHIFFILNETLIFILND